MSGASAASAASGASAASVALNGNLRFCEGCQNLMIAKSYENQLLWECSINCAFSQTPGANQNLSAKTSCGGVIVLSQTTDSDFAYGQNPRNVFTRYDPTLLRTMKVCPHKERPEHQSNPDIQSEVIVFRQNLVTAHSYYICTVCDQKIDLA